MTATPENTLPLDSYGWKQLPDDFLQTATPRQVLENTMDTTERFMVGQISAEKVIENHYLTLKYMENMYCTDKHATNGMIENDYIRMYQEYDKLTFLINASFTQSEIETLKLLNEDKYERYVYRSEGGSPIRKIS